MNEMMSKNAIDNYYLLEKVYENYIETQEKLNVLINNYKSQSKTIKILEIGCGTGITTNIILSSRDDIKVTAIDIDPNAIKQSHKNLNKWSNDKLKLVLTDALEYLSGCDNNSFDIIVSAFTIHNFSQEYRNNIYETSYSVMKKKSLFINADKYVPDNEELQIKGLKYCISRYVDVLIKEGKRELLKEWIIHYIDDQSPDKIMRANEAKKNMYEYGFKEIKFIYKSAKENIAILQARK